MPRRKLKKSIWVPLILALYAAAMSIYFGPGLIAEGHSTKLWISVAFEAAVVIGVFFVQRRKEKLADHWNEK